MCNNSSPWDSFDILSSYFPKGGRAWNWAYLLVDIMSTPVVIFKAWTTSNYSLYQLGEDQVPGSKKIPLVQLQVPWVIARLLKFVYNCFSGSSKLPEHLEIWHMLQGHSCSNNPQLRLEVRVNVHKQGPRGQGSRTAASLYIKLNNVQQQICKELCHRCLKEKFDGSKIHAVW